MGAIDEDDEEERIEARYGYSRQNFEGRLKRSVQAVQRVVVFFEQNGVQVEAPELTLRERMDQIENYSANDCDVVLSGTAFGFEVKGRPNLIFSGIRDFPYPTVSVDTVSGYRSKATKPLAYLTVSGDLRSMLVLPTFTESSWIRERKVDHERRLSDQFYFAEPYLFKPRRWLIELSLALQAAPADEAATILWKYGYQSSGAP